MCGEVKAKGQESSSDPENNTKMLLDHWKEEEKKEGKTKGRGR